MEWRTDWENAPKDGTPIFVHDGVEPHKTRWGKAAHVPLYGFMDPRISDPEDMDILRDLVGWLPLDAPPPPPVQKEIQP